MTAFIDLGVPEGWRAEIRRCTWGYEARFADGLVVLRVCPWRPSRRWIERVARRKMQRLQRSAQTYWLDS